MKSLIVSSLVLFVFAVAVSAQKVDPRCADACETEKAGRGLDARRVPAAASYKDEMGTTVYTINANESWRRTEIEVQCGQRIEIVAGGMVRWAPDGIEKIDVTPDGTRPPYRDGWNYRHFPFPETGIGSLVMRIGKGIYPAGSSVVVEAEDAGFIEFMVNDDKLDDNSGLFYVKVNVKPSEQ